MSLKSKTPIALEGLTTAGIARRLNERGVTTPLCYKNHKVGALAAQPSPRWSHVMVLNILQNIKYTGAMTNHTRESRHLRDRNQRRVPAEDWIVTEGTHQAIVGREEYDAATTPSCESRRRRFDRLQRYRVVKQADVLLLMTRLPGRFTEQERLDAWAALQRL